MAITQQQASTVVTVCGQLSQTLQQLEAFANQVQVLLNNNWQTPINVGGITLTTTIIPTDQATILAQYATLKQGLATLYAQLP